MNDELLASDRSITNSSGVTKVDDNIGIDSSLIEGADSLLGRIEVTIWREEAYAS